MSENKSEMSDRALKHADGLIGIRRFDGRKSCILYDVDRSHTQHHLVFDDKHVGLISK
jgi:hypothetical protein